MKTKRDKISLKKRNSSQTWRSWPRGRNNGSNQSESQDRITRIAINQDQIVNKPLTLFLGWSCFNDSLRYLSHAKENWSTSRSIRSFFFLPAYQMTFNGILLLPLLLASSFAWLLNASNLMTDGPCFTRHKRGKENKTGVDCLFHHRHTQKTWQTLIQKLADPTVISFRRAGCDNDEHTHNTSSTQFTIRIFSFLFHSQVSHVKREITRQEQSLYVMFFFSQRN